MTLELPLLAPPTRPSLRRDEALLRLLPLVGEDLGPLAQRLGIAVGRGAARNKGWAGQVVERLLGRAPNGEKSSDFEDFELKVVPFVHAAEGFRLKETMAIGMFTEAELQDTPFEDSHLLKKLRRLLVVARTFEPPDDAVSLVLKVAAFDLSEPALFAQVKADYEEAQWLARHEGAFALCGAVGRLIQPRPKGVGYAGGGLAFYAKKALVLQMLGL